MNQNDKVNFAGTLKQVLACYNRDVTKEVTDLWWRLFADVPLAEFTNAAEAWLRESRFAPTPADILGRCPATNLGHPDPETAWNLAPKSERDTAWVTQEILVALAACQDSLDRGDLIGARMAFLETYRQQLQAARSERRKAKVWLSMGCGLTMTQAEMAQNQANQLAASVGMIALTHEADSELLTHDGSKKAEVLALATSLSRAKKP